jgi:hypothetical protein
MTWYLMKRGRRRRALFKPVLDEALGGNPLAVFSGTGGAWGLVSYPRRATSGWSASNVLGGIARVVDRAPEGQVGDTQLATHPGAGPTQRRGSTSFGRLVGSRGQTTWSEHS